MTSNKALIYQYITARIVFLKRSHLVLNCVIITKWKDCLWKTCPTWGQLLKLWLFRDDQYNFLRVSLEGIFLGKGPKEGSYLHPILSQKDCWFLCSVGISDHVPVYTASLIEPVWDTGWCLGVCTCMLICHIATVGRAIGKTLSLHKTPKSEGWFGMGSFHQHTDTWRRADNSQLNKRPPMFSQDISFVKLCQRVGNIPFLENGSGGLGSEHTSVVCTAIFSPES